MTKEELIQDITAMQSLKETLLNEIHNVIIGQDRVLTDVLIALFANGHILLEGVPGLAKTLLISSLAKALSLSFSRIQFTPDLMPSDITGTEILVNDPITEKKHFEYIKGPIFANIILADEINRTPPKTQAALLQAMQEYAVTSGTVTRPLSKPFLVMATQNPIEQEGTYPLPEAQLDRFMFFINIDYPTLEEELQIAESTTGLENPVITPQLTGQQIISLQQAVRSLPVSDHVLKFAVNLVRKSRPNTDDALNEIKQWVAWGAGPRASQYLILSAKARAALDGRLTPAEEDVKASAINVLQHRILPSFAAQAEGINSKQIINWLLEQK
ncbi:AAA family ATPase [Candidatus Cloacimonas acidaminovorans]|uniref:MoxR family protein n=1 Tax=Cloacimonas acidaminovorans (strain Evry) TaxID=459349 RepID=B0VIP0_CLOAI|nr:MoxR family ATPase [Candidatus Cloacimonas acidaminovorans]CAO81181.1 MoxR family protein [Candidatus Cloacimonas acidaminovorans str. Evry]HNZ89552.1 MoxR family ATPase [Candidatus Cloacimonas acidaminovorans]HOI02045.1 MoxR family ATPase [Candidatus Cloacimonas acidaminovorans]HPI43199.1 MoxR family ATPase [Candidatus Cloacimonas acidaminovorans]HPU99904.1 MoxR family ATPase [Candidatus Cloacimonas acidaminovorans]